MLKNLFNKNAKLYKMLTLVEEDLRYAERMMLVYRQEYREHPGDVRAKEQYDFWRGKREAFMVTYVVMKDLYNDKSRK